MDMSGYFSIKGKPKLFNEIATTHRIGRKKQTIKIWKSVCFITSLLSTRHEIGTLQDYSGSASQGRQTHGCLRNVRGSVRDHTFHDRQTATTDVKKMSPICD